MTSLKPHVLYYMPALCSLAPHIVLRELAIPFELVRVDRQSHAMEGGGALRDVTAKDYIPVLALPDGEILTETSAILLYLGDLQPARKLAPPPASFARVRFHEQLGFLSTELHKSFAPFTIMPNPSEDSRRWAADRLTARVALLDAALGDQPYLTGGELTVLDAYAYWALGSYSRLVKVPLPERLRHYVERIAARPSVRAARQAEAA